MATDTVILVPGFLGSVIGEYDLTGLSPIDVIWLNPVRLLSGGFRRLRLPTADDPEPPGAPLDPGYPLPYYYWPLVRGLERLGWRVVSPAGDWRLGASHDAVLLAELIRSESADGRVSLVCHSRGGLVARLALGILSATNPGQYVSRIIYMGTPHLGSLVAAENLGGWSYTQRAVRNLGRYLPAPVSDLIGFEEIYRVMRSWQGMYDLLPPAGAAWVQGISDDTLYLPQTWAHSPVRPVPDKLATARAWWATLPDFPPSVLHYMIEGRDIWTPIGVPDAASLADTGSLSGTTDGDGVVPTASARPGPYFAVSAPCQHDLLPAYSVLYPIIDSILRVGLSSDIRIEGPPLTL